MKIEVLGTRGKVEPSAPKYQNHSGFLIEDRILLDLGEPHFLERNPEAIVFTHFIRIMVILFLTMKSLFRRYRISDPRTICSSPACR